MTGPDHSIEPDRGERRLSELGAGQSCRVVRVQHKPELLEGFCIYPGARLTLLQKYPAYLVAVEGLEFAFEDELAQGIWVEPV